MPSHGAVAVPLPNVFCWFLGKCEFLHYTAIYYLPPNLDVTIRWYPEEDDKVFLIFALSFGDPRDFQTNEVVYTDEVGFWHRGMGMKLHWDPLVQSILGITYPHITPATKENPFEIRFVNKTNRMIYIDVSVWYFEYSRKSFEEFISFARGFIKFFRLIDKTVSDEVSAEDLRKIAEVLRK